MKLIKTASGKKQIKMSRKEWETIGKTAGWMKEAATPPSQIATVAITRLITGLQSALNEIKQNPNASQQELLNIIEATDALEDGTIQNIQKLMGQSYSTIDFPQQAQPQQPQPQAQPAQPQQAAPQQV